MRVPNPDSGGTNPFGELAEKQDPRRLRHAHGGTPAHTHTVAAPEDAEEEDEEDEEDDEEDYDEEDEDEPEPEGDEGEEPEEEDEPADEEEEEEPVEARVGAAAVSRKRVVRKRRPPFVREAKKGHGEIHSAKAHRCVEKVGAKGHAESSAWAICTTSIGKSGVYAKGHGGSASPKRKVHEADGSFVKPMKVKGQKRRKPMLKEALDREYERIVHEADRGQFEEVPLDPFAEHGTPGQKNYPHGKGKGKGKEEEPKYATADVARGSSGWATRPQDAASQYGAGTVTGKGVIGGPKAKAVTGLFVPGVSPKAERVNVAKKTSHPVTFHDLDKGPGGRYHVATYRDMEIHTLPGFMTPYYFVNAPGFGSMQHSPSLTRIKRQINTFKDTGVTAHRAERTKASARYQRRKAKGY